LKPKIEENPLWLLSLSSSFSYLRRPFNFSLYLSVTSLYGISFLQVKLSNS
ncbi:unnamed protein product, partial [Prunus brigantina]